MDSDLSPSSESAVGFPDPSQAGHTLDAHMVAEGPSVSTLSYKRMPPELWLSVFKSNWLPPEDLRSISLTQHLFRALAQPLIFRRIQISTSSKWFDDGCNPRSYQTPEYIERFRHRLSFVGSDRIAPAVEEISIIGNYIAGPIPHLIDSAPLFDLLLGSLHYFHNLSELSSDSMILTTPMIKALYALPRLHYLDLTWCSLESSAIPFDDIPRSRLLKFKHLEDYSNTETTFHWWLPFISREKSRNISVSGHLQSNPLLQFITRGSPMLCLRTLEISTISVESPHFVDAMKKCPSLRNLSLHDPRPPLLPPHDPVPNTIQRFVESDAAPLLDRIRIPPTYAIAFVRARPIRKLQVSSSMSVSSTEDLLDEIKEHRPQLSELVLSVRSFKMDFLETTLAFPSIAWLSFYIRNPLTDVEVEQVCDTLRQASLLPRGLQYLSITSSPARSVEKRETVETRYPDLDARFRAECPELNKFSVTGGNFAVLWAKDEVWAKLG